MCSKKPKDRHLGVSEMPNGYLNTDEVTDVICSLQLTLDALDSAKQNSLYWKWIILALHSAVQGAIVCNLSGTAQLGACGKDSAKQWLCWHDDDDRSEKISPKLWLADPRTMLKRLLGEEDRIESTGAKVIKMNQDQRNAFEMLCELRNGFVHFHPMSWSIELAGLPNMVSQILIFIEAIYEDGWSFRHAGDDQKATFTKTIVEIKKRLSNLTT